MSKADSTWSRIFMMLGNKSMTGGDNLTMLLNIGLEALDISLGCISYVKGQTYTLYHATNEELEGQTLNIRDTICNIVIRADDVVTLPHLSATAWKDHRSYEIFGFEAYIGVPLKVMTRPFGTLFFAQYHVREQRFSEREIAFIRLLQGTISGAIAARTTKPLPHDF